MARPHYLEGGGRVTGRPGEFEGPKDDDLHTHNGDHRKVPPPGVNPLTWGRRMRTHMEGHGRDDLVRKIAPNLFPPE